MSATPSDLVVSKIFAASLRHICSLMVPRKLESKTPSIISSTALCYSEKEVAFVLWILGLVDVEQGLAREIPGYYRLEVVYQEEVFRLLSIVVFRYSEETYLVCEDFLDVLLVGMLYVLEDYFVEEAMIGKPCLKF